MHFVFLTVTVVLGSLNYFGYIIPVSIKLENMRIFQISFFHLQHTIHQFSLDGFGNCVANSFGPHGSWTVVCVTLMQYTLISFSICIFVALHPIWWIYNLHIAKDMFLLRIIVNYELWLYSVEVLIVIYPCWCNYLEARLRTHVTFR
jgi:hypothetical protein